MFMAIQIIVLIAGVTPLFTAVGYSLKLTVLAFYSFSFAGAIGGLAFHQVLKTVFRNRMPGHPAPVESPKPRTHARIPHDAHL